MSRLLVVALAVACVAADTTLLREGITAHAQDQNEAKIWNDVIECKYVDRLASLVGGRGAGRACVCLCVCVMP
jgi:hypothetical protein